jgi:hypothetical protein
MKGWISPAPTSFPAKVVSHVRRGSVSLTAAWRTSLPTPSPTGRGAAGRAEWRRASRRASSSGHWLPSPVGGGLGARAAPLTLLLWHAVCVLRHSALAERTVCTAHLLHPNIRRVPGRKRCQEHVGRPASDDAHAAGLRRCRAAVNRPDAGALSFRATRKPLGLPMGWLTSSRTITSRSLYTML